RVLDGDALPDVWRPRQLACEPGQSRTSLREYLEDVPVCAGHHVKDVMDILCRHRFMEQIAHAIYENALRSTPAEGEAELIRMKSQCETITVPGVAHRAQPNGQALRVAVLAARADLRAAGHRIPGGVGPFDPALITHDEL